MNLSKKLMLASLLAALAVTVAAPMSAYARQGADDPAKHNAGDQRGGNGKDDPAGHR